MDVIKYLLRITTEMLFFYMRTNKIQPALSNSTTYTLYCADEIVSGLISFFSLFLILLVYTVGKGTKLMENPVSINSKRRKNETYQ